MPRSRRKGLGSSAADHSHEGSLAAQRTREEATRTYKAIEAGDCTAALSHLLTMNNNAGEAVAHSKAGGSIPDLTIAMDDVIGIRGIFERKCQFKKVRR